jgi:hypothetical protein
MRWKWNVESFVMGDVCIAGSEYREQLAAYAHDTLGEDDVQVLERHINGCRVCAVELAQLETLADLEEDSILHEEEPGHPSLAAVAALEEEFIQAEPAPEPEPVPVTEPPKIEHVRATLAHAIEREYADSRHWMLTWRVFGPAIALTCAVLAVTAVVEREHTQDLQQRLERAEHRPHLDALANTPITSVATRGAWRQARVEVAVDHNAGLIAIRNVPAPPPGAAWNVWSVDDNHHISRVGTIKRTVRMTFIPVLGQSVARVFVTAEHRPGIFPSSEHVADGPVQSVR